jgi:hypothetical protein
MPLLDFPYAEKFNTYASTEYNGLHRFGIRFTKKYETVDHRCAMCQTSVSPIFPSSIKGMSGQVLFEPYCMKCLEHHVPQLFKIFKQVCASVMLQTEMDKSLKFVNLLWISMKGICYEEGTQTV